MTERRVSYQWAGLNAEKEMNKKKVIEIKNLSKIYDLGDKSVSVLAVSDVALTVTSGEWVSIMGPSGSGKSTLMHILGCLDKPTSGKYFLMDEEVSSFDQGMLASVRNRRIGFVFQAFHLLPRETAIENVELPLLYAADREHRRKALTALERLGMIGRKDHLPSQLSGGQKQRVAIARALVMNPDILLADEPTGALDTATGEEILEIVESLNKDGMTIIMVTHELDVASRAQRLISMRDGKIEKDSILKKAAASGLGRGESR